MAYITANPLAYGTTYSSTALPLLDNSALNRLAGCPCAAQAAYQTPGQQLMQLQLSLYNLLTNLMQPTTHNSHKSQQQPTQPGGKSKFNVASFNVLGASHTTAHGNKPGLASGAERMRGAVAALKNNDVDIAGIQEFQPEQINQFKKLAPNFGVVTEQENSIVYNKDKFKLVDRKSFSIPYFAGGTRKMPVVQLEDKQTGKRMWVVNVHNPADTKRFSHNAANRAKAVAIEQDFIRQLKATGLPVIVTGDFNERGSLDNRLGLEEGANSGVDWIFGSRGVDFSRSRTDRSVQSNGTSDHPLVVSTATV
ncbi:MAG: endonuclease/exonuclease/phosphatase family protein [Candidatus Eremiobacteraeota bacterium]|nr:endonuclease/exonuclease/phosphatase family protein [Candidatus Eremiobacteraeota bacterium]